MFEHSRPALSLGARRARAGSRVNEDLVRRHLGERDLLSLIKGHVLSRLTIVETCIGRFQLRVSRTVEAVEYVLVNTRGKPRDWYSLDTLANHIRKRYGPPNRILLALKPSSDNALVLGISRVPDLGPATNSAHPGVRDSQLLSSISLVPFEVRPTARPPATCTNQLGDAP
jgi:hypothetical protein